MPLNAYIPLFIHLKSLAKPMCLPYSISIEQAMENDKGQTPKKTPQATNGQSVLSADEKAERF